MLKAEAPELEAISSDLLEKVKELKTKINPIKELVDAVIINTF